MTFNRFPRYSLRDMRMLNGTLKSPGLGEPSGETQGKCETLMFKKIVRKPEQDKGRSLENLKSILLSCFFSTNNHFLKSWQRT